MGGGISRNRNDRAVMNPSEPKASLSKSPKVERNAESRPADILDEPKGNTSSKESVQISRTRAETRMNSNLQIDENTTSDMDNCITPRRTITSNSVKSVYGRNELEWDRSRSDKLLKISSDMSPLSGQARDDYGYSRMAIDSPQYHSNGKDASDHDNPIDDTDNDAIENEIADKNAEMFQNTAMSLGMDNDELLFNLLYFGDNAGGSQSFGNMVNSALEETVALHSDNNTPYKLQPASEDDLADLLPTTLMEELRTDDSKCAVCRDDIVLGDTFIRLVGCQHCFHADCLIRWLKLQAWCPTCRQSIHRDGDKNTNMSRRPSRRCIPHIEPILESPRADSGECKSTGRPSASRHQSKYQENPSRHQDEDNDEVRGSDSMIWPLLIIIVFDVVSLAGH